MFLSSEGEARSSFDNLPLKKEGVISVAASFAFLIKKKNYRATIIINYDIKNLLAIGLSCLH